jgi:hypothetical protein
VRAVKARAEAPPDLAFSLVDDPLLRLQRMLRLAPAEGFGPLRRTLLLVAVTWLPIIVWAAASGYLPLSKWQDSITGHLGVHVRCLLAIPLFIFSEPIANRVIQLIVGNFVPSGLVHPDDRGKFTAVLRSVERWRDSKLVWGGILALVTVIVLTVKQQVLADTDLQSWTHGAVSMDFGGRWAFYVVRPIFFLLALVWLWRLTVTGILFRKLSRLDLRLVPSHPDMVGGLGFIKLHSSAFSLVVLALSSVACAGVAHQMLAHGARFEQFQIALITLAVLLAAVFALPLGSFSSKLRHVSTRARFQYGNLTARYLLGLHERWVEGHAVAKDPIHEAPEIGPAADVATLYAMGTKMRMAPVGQIQAFALLLPAAAPVVAVLALEVPLVDLLVKILGMLG